MKSINRNDFIEIGTITRVHGTRGELKTALLGTYTFKEWAFLEIKGKPVPFLITSVIGSADEPILKLEGIDSPDQASRFLGMAVLKLGKGSKAKGKKLDDSIVGYAIMDEERGLIGTVEDVMELPQQLLLQTQYNGTELLIPAVDEIILSIDDKKKVIQVNLPDGILDIN